VTTGRRGWLAFGLGAGAVAWATALVVVAFTVPSYSGESCQVTPGGAPTCSSASQTLFAVNGWWVVELLVGVTLVAAIALWALHMRCSRPSTGATTAATCCIVGLFAFSVVSGFSIGLFVLPVVLLLTASARLTPAAAARPDR
jgi:multisubunit Na+/H+ antiporter MnhG subunit